LYGKKAGFFELSGRKQAQTEIVINSLGMSMSDCVKKLVHRAYEAEDTALSGKVQTRMKKIMRRYQG
jgi:hypothetical protein